MFFLVNTQSNYSCLCTCKHFIVTHAAVLSPSLPPLYCHTCCSYTLCELFTPLYTRPGQVDVSLTLAVTALILRTVLHVISTAKHGLEKYAFHQMFYLLFHHTIIIARGAGWWHGLISINRLPPFPLCHRLLCETQTLLHWTSLMSTLKNVQTLQD